MEILDSLNISNTRLYIYYSLVIIAAIYTLKRFGVNRYTVFVVLLFWTGLFDFLEYIGLFNADLLKVLLFFYALGLFGRSVFQNKAKNDAILNLVFLLFSLSFWYTYVMHPGNWLTWASQYSMKYAFPFLIYHGLKSLHFKQSKTVFIAKLILFIILVQVVLSVLKVISFGGFMESVVGSTALIGGGNAVTFPLLALFFIWADSKGSFNRKYWLIAGSILFIAIASMKRTPMFAFPLFVALLFLYVRRNSSFSALLKYLPLGFLLLYIGVRANFTLNPDKKVWGRFDLEYAWKYAIFYNFGTYDLSKPTEITSGRGGSLLLLFHPKSLNLTSIEKKMFGNGVAAAVTRQRGRFLGGREYNIEHKGLMGAFTMEVYKLGYSGAILYLLFIMLIINKIKYYKLKIVMIIWFFIDYFLYYGFIVFVPALFFLLMFTIYYLNINYNNESVTSRSI
ncbi:MAG: hypothetical protein AB2L17_19040 [Lentimicrobium sp.]